jgi:Flp pilus assembly protein TadG
MLLIAFGAIDVGRYFFDYISLRNAASEGALYGARYLDASSTDIRQRVTDHFLPAAPPAGMAVPTANRDANCASVGNAGFVTVTVTRPFSPLSLGLLDVVAPDGTWSLTVQATAKARCMT